MTTKKKRLIGEQIHQKAVAMIRESYDRDDPPLTWWMSFCDSSRPKGQQFLGVIVVDDCRSLPEAMLKVVGVNPGGEVQAAGFPREAIPESEREHMDRLPRGVLLSKAQLTELGCKA